MSIDLNGVMSKQFFFENPLVSDVIRASDSMATVVPRSYTQASPSVGAGGQFFVCENITFQR
jgi:hypothetical protein